MAVLIAVPGPSVLFVVSRGVTLGRRAAVSTAIGNEAGLLVQVLLVVFGLGKVIEHCLLIFSILKFVGALYWSTWAFRLGVSEGCSRCT